jgi:hypothetical protein
LKLRFNEVQDHGCIGSEFWVGCEVVFDASRLPPLQSAFQVDADEMNKRPPSPRIIGREVIVDGWPATVAPGLLESFAKSFEAMPKAR